MISTQESLLSACENNELDILEKLLQNNNNDINERNEYDDTLLVTAYIKGDCCDGILECLIKHNADINYINKYGISVLSHACRHDSGCTDKVKILLENGANVNNVCTGSSRQQTTTYLARTTPLHEACKLGSYFSSEVSTVRVLLEAGANPNQYDKVGMTPLHYATLFGKEDIVSLLLEYGADPDIADKKGRTALHMIHGTPSYLVKANSVNDVIVDLLLEYSADMDLMDDNCVSPLSMHNCGIERKTRVAHKMIVRKLRR